MLERGPQDLAENLGALIADFITSRIDPITGLVQRRVFFETLAEQLEEDFPDFRKSGTIDHTVDSPVVLVGDLAFLNLFNSISHERGDEVLARVGSILAKHFPDCWVGRLGGDEFGVWNGDYMLSDILHRKVLAETEITTEPDGSYEVTAIGQYIDIEDATLRDVFLYQQMGGTIHPSYSALAQVLFNIAMTRAQVTKCYKRLTLLIQASLLNDGTYEKLIPYARKGAGNVTDKEIQDFATIASTNEDVSPRCLQFAIDRRRLSIEDDLNASKIFEVATRIFYE